MALAIASIFQGFSQNILRDAVFSSGATPHTGYTLETLGYGRPDWRLIFDDDSLTISAVTPAARQGDLLVIPMSNLRAGEGSPISGLRLQNDAGMDVPIVTPELLPNDLPRT